MKLARLLALHLKHWPVNRVTGNVVDAISQGLQLDLYTSKAVGNGRYSYPTYFGVVPEHASDASSVFVTKDMYELELKRVKAESWLGHPDTPVPLHAFCIVVKGGCSWDDSNSHLIGKKVEVIGKATTSYGLDVYSVELDDGTTHTLIRKCLERAQTESDLRAEKEIEEKASKLFEDGRAGSAYVTPWDKVDEDVKALYRNAIKAGWSKA